MRQAEQAIGLTRHRAHDQHDLVALTLRAQRKLGYVSHPVQVADRSTTEFLNDECHGVSPGSPHDRARQGGARRRVQAREAVIASSAGMSPLAHYVLETLVTLLAIVALSVLVLLGARRAGMGRSAGPLELVGRLPLDGRRAVYLVRVGTTVYVVGASEAGIAKLGEVSDGSIELPSATN